MEVEANERKRGGEQESGAMQMRKHEREMLGIVLSWR